MVCERPLGSAARASLSAIAVVALGLHGAACVPEGSDPAAPSLGPARTTSAPFDAAVDDAADAGDADAAPPISVCDAGSLGAIDLTRAAVTFGGATPATWSVGKASGALGPQHDHRFVPDRSFLATRPGALYSPFEDGFAEIIAPDLGALPAGCKVTLHAWVWYEIEDLRDGANLVLLGAGPGASDGGAPAPLGVAQGPSLYDVDGFQDVECATDACLVRGQAAWSSFAPGSTSWREATFDLTRLAGLPHAADAAARPRLRFQFHSDHFGEYQGFYVDDLTLTSP